MTNDLHAKEAFLKALAAGTPDISTVEYYSRNLGPVPDAPTGDEISVGGEAIMVPPGPGRTMMITADGRYGIAIERITETTLDQYQQRDSGSPLTAVTFGPDGEIIETRPDGRSFIHTTEQVPE